MAYLRTSYMHLRKGWYFLFLIPIFNQKYLLTRGVECLTLCLVTYYFIKFITWPKKETDWQIYEWICLPDLKLHSVKNQIKWNKIFRIFIWNRDNHGFKSNETHFFQCNSLVRIKPYEFLCLLMWSKGWLPKIRLRWTNHPP